MRLPTTLKTFPRWLPLVSRHVVAGIVVACGLLLALGVLSYRNLQRQATAADWVAHTYNVAVALQDVYANIQDADSAQRLYVVSGNESPLVNYERAAQAMPSLLNAVALLVGDNPAQVQRLKILRDDIVQKLDLIRERIEQRRQLGVGALDTKYINGNSVRLMDAVRGDVATMTAEENRLLRERLRLLAAARARSVEIQMVGGLASIGLLVWVFFSLLKESFRANRAEEDAKRSNVQLRAANDEMRAFSYSVAHDLRTPLRAIGGFAQVVVEDYGDKLDAEGQRVLSRITGNAKMMGQLIDDLLALSKITYQPIHAAKVDMDSLVRGIYGELTEQKDGRVVECEIAPLPPASGDGALLRQVWLNLIANALKFTRQRQKARIEIGGIIAGPEFVTYFIKDNGAGFDMQYADKLFGAFQRLHRPDEFEGTGIGLALVQRIIHRHGGTVWAEGKENEGAQFAFTLPEWVQN